MWINSPYTCGLFSRLSFLLHWSVSVFTPVLYYSDYCSFVIQGSWCHQLYCSFSRLLWLFLVFHGSIHGEMRLLGEPDLEPLTLVQSSGLSFRALAEAGQTVWNKTWTPCCALIPQPSLEISLKVVWNVAAERGAGEIQQWRRDGDARVVHGENMEQMGKQRRPNRVNWEGRAQCKKPYLRSEQHCSKPYMWHPVEPAISKADFSLSNPNFSLSSQVGCRELCKVSISLSAYLCQASSFFFNSHLV